MSQPVNPQTGQIYYLPNQTIAQSVSQPIARQTGQTYYPQQYPSNFYHPQFRSFRKKSSPMLGFWGKRILAVVVLVVVIWLLYQYGCDIPIINLLCPIGRLIIGFFSGLASGLNWLTDLF